MGRSGSYLNNSITSAWSEHSLDPEDIRVRIMARIFIRLSFIPKDVTNVTDLCGH